MAKIRLSLGKRNNIFLYSTRVENLFINEFLPAAPGEYVKVYLFGLMYAQYDQRMESDKIAMQLGLTEAELEEAWAYWEAGGMIRRRVVRDANNEELVRIDFVSLVEELYGRTPDSGGASVSAGAYSDARSFGEDESAGAFAGAGGGIGEGALAGADPLASEDEAAADVSMYVSIDDMDFEEAVADKLTDRQLAGLYQKFQAAAGRTISRRETSKISDAIRVYNIEPEVFSYAIDYCLDLGKDSIDYIFTVALRWNEEGCRTVDEVKAVLEKHSLRNSWYSKVFKALGWSRLPAPADREMMDRWFDVMNCSIAEVLDACYATAGIREPNLRYVNKVLENRRLERGGINTRAMNSGPGSGMNAGSMNYGGANAGSGYSRGGGSNAAGGDTSGGGSMVSRKVLSDYYEYIREESEREQKARIKECREKIPDMNRIYEAENAVNSKLLSLRPGDENKDLRQSLRAERLRIEEARKSLLEAYGFPPDYLSRKYRCAKCRDTGYTDEGMVCSCARERAEEAYKWIGDKESRK